MTPNSILGRAFARRDVFVELTRREVYGRYSGSALGVLWSFFNPLLMLAVYTVAFRTFLGMRWPSASSSADFSLMIFSGMIVHSLLTECLMGAPTVMVNHANLVKKVVFPLAILPCVTVASGLFHACLSMLVLLLFTLYVQHGLHWTVLYLPFLYLPYLMLLCGISWFMASLGVFVRDVVQISGVLATIFMFLSPVFYPEGNLKEPYRQFMKFNPLTLIIEQTRAVVLFGQAPDWGSLLIYALVACLAMMFGYWWFQRTRDGFADVL